MPLQILLADDNLAVRSRVRGLLEQQGFEVIGEASDGLEAVRLAQASRPDIAVLDLAMPVLNGVGAAREIHRCSPKTRMIMLSLYTDDSFVRAALRAGIRGYVSKAELAENLPLAILEVAQGRICLSPSILQNLGQSPLEEPGVKLHTPDHSRISNPCIV
ncbi:MAG TPA: response regulator transcription factor [Candidatus Methylomirabilis sp.]|nr:response regulator transcription factor [Candidatus Methylomirabilis sp.]